MAISYKKLFKLLIDRKMKKKDLCETAGISTTSVSKLAKDQNVTTEILDKICKALNCNTDDIMEYINDEETGGAQDEQQP